MTQTKDLKILTCCVTVGKSWRCVFTGNRTRDSEIPAQRADHYTMNTAQRASPHLADTVLCAASFYPPVSMRHSIAYLGL